MAFGVYWRRRATAGPNLIEPMHTLRPIWEDTADPVDEQTIKDTLDVGRGTGAGGKRRPTARTAGAQRRPQGGTNVHQTDGAQ